MKTVYRKISLPANIDTVFELLTNLKTLQYIAFPFASFKPISDEQKIKWEEGHSFSFKFSLFGFIPFGKHLINVIDFKKTGIYTKESNTYVPIWNHRIKLTDNGDGTTEYSDEVEIEAGWKTFIVWCWANCFYAHRQKKWIKLLKKKSANMF